MCGCSGFAPHETSMTSPLQRRSPTAQSTGFSRVARAGTLPNTILRKRAVRSEERQRVGGLFGTCFDVRPQPRKAKRPERGVVAGLLGGKGEIRTHGTPKRTPDFESVTLQNGTLETRTGSASRSSHTVQLPNTFPFAKYGFRLSDTLMEYNKIQTSVGSRWLCSHNPGRCVMRGRRLPSEVSGVPTARRPHWRGDMQLIRRPSRHPHEPTSRKGVGASGKAVWVAPRFPNRS